MYVFDLPVDVAIKQFKEMNEAFWSKRKNQTLPNPLFPAALLSKHSLKQTFDLSHLKANTIVVVVLKDVDFLTYIKRWKKRPKKNNLENPITFVIPRPPILIKREDIS